MGLENFSIGTKQILVMVILYERGKARPIEIRAVYQAVTGEGISKQNLQPTLNSLMRVGYLQIAGTETIEGFEKPRKAVKTL